MMLVKKSPADLLRLREACRLSRRALDEACAQVRPGISTAEIDRVAEAVIREHGGTPEFLGYHGYTHSTCISVNDEVVHGVPGERVIREGDLVSIDVGARLDGWVGDNAATILVGEGHAEDRRLSEATKAALDAAIETCRPGKRLSDVARAVEQTAVTTGFRVVRDFTGHGIGEEMHEAPDVPNYVDEHLLENDIVLEEGLCLAIEPMLVAGRPHVQILADGWTAVTCDGSRAAHWEDVVAVTKDGPRILTRP